MPGSRLSGTEKGLQKWWESSPTPFPVLRSMRVVGLRGIGELEVHFEHPVTAICGRNGAGKSTLLALVALAFGGTRGLVPPGAARRPLAGEDFSYYTFRDFFFRGMGDPEYGNVEIDWRYDGPLKRMDGRAVTSPVSVRKQSSKWMRYERRPERAVYFVGAIRSVPAVERSVLRNHFGAARTGPTKPLDARFLKRLGEIMGRDYSDAATVTVTRYSLRKCASGGSPYSSFNMGAGEDILIEILQVLHDAPLGALVVIEEIELGLHPNAAGRLARHIQEVALEKKLQVVVSTHSLDFLDALPRQGRLLLHGSGSHRRIVQGPTSRFAMGALTEVGHPELLVYCEDQFAERLIESALPSTLRQRVKIIPVGASSELAQQAAFHKRAGLRERALIMWDGDVSDAKARGWIDAAFASQPGGAAWVKWATLPGGQAPERWVLALLATPAGRAALATSLVCDETRAAEIVDRLEACSDPHAAAYELSQMESLDEGRAAQILVDCAKAVAGAELASVADEVNRALDP